MNFNAAYSDIQEARISAATSRLAEIIAELESSDWDDDELAEEYAEALCDSQPYVPYTNNEPEIEIIIGNAPTPRIGL